MRLDPIILSIPVYFLLIGIELLVERISHQKIYRLNDALTNISCGITQQLTGLFFKVASIGVYQYIYTYWRIWDIPSNWYTLIILFVAVDFAYYWAHRKSHEINLFWGGHVVHHQSEDYNFSVALRQSSFQVLWTFFYYLPLAIIGFNTLDFVLMAALTTVYQFWIHTETIGKLGPLEYVFNTPSHHRVHHGRDPKYIDRNHAGVFIIWDKMFGTFQEEEERPTYGITKPINSWNPVWANLEHYQHMAHEIKQIPGFANKVKYVFKKPGWLPATLGGYQAAPQVDKDNYAKYDTQSPLRLNFYVLFQYVLTLGGTAWFLFNQASFDLSEKIWISGLIIWTVVNCGALMEKQKWGQWAEILRIVTISSISCWMAYLNNWSFQLLGPGLAYLFLSSLWLFYALAVKTTTVKPAIHE